jgi:hypothetical protein
MATALNVSEAQAAIPASLAVVLTVTPSRVSVMTTTP